MRSRSTRRRRGWTATPKPSRALAGGAPPLASDTAPMNGNLFALIESRVHPADPFIETEDGRRYSYGDMLAMSARYANALVASGVRAGDRVVAQTEKSPEAYCLYLAVLRAGAVFVPLNTAYCSAELEYFLRESEPSVFVCD